MSFILDALDKSERERQAGTVPTLATPQAVHARNRKRRRVLPAASIFLMCAIPAAAWWWTSTRPAPTTAGADDTTRAERAVAPDTARPAGPAIPTRTAPAQQPREFTPREGGLQGPSQAASESRDGADRIAVPELITPSAPAPVSPISIAALPTRVQEQLPAMNFSSHIFADDPSLRRVSINGKFLKEGEMVDQGLKLLEITEDGVVLGWLHYTFEMSVLRDWAL